MHRYDVIIIGGGISGASALNWLASTGVNVLLLERGPRLGGVMGSRRSELGALMETGPTSAQMKSDALIDLIESLGLTPHIVRPSEVAANRYIMRGGELIPAPTSPRSFVRSRLFSTAAKLRAFREPFVASASGEVEESVAQFVERRLGREMLDYAVNPFISGIYAGRPEHLSARYAFPVLHELEQASGSLFKGGMRKAREARKDRKKNGENGASQRKGIFSFDEGMGMLPKAIEERWHSAVRTDVTVQRIERRENTWMVYTGAGIFLSERIVLATEAGAAAELLEGLDGTAAAALRSIEHPPVTVAHALYDRSAVAHPLDGFGLLIPEVEKRNILGVIFSSSLFPGRAPEGTVLLTAFIGGARSPELALRPHDEMLYDVHGELRRSLGISVRPKEFEAQVWPRAIPQYNLGYGAILDVLAGAEHRLHGLHLLGSYRGGVSIGDCVSSARTLARKILNEKGVPADDARLTTYRGEEEERLIDHPGAHS